MAAPVRADDDVRFRKVTVHICSRAGNTNHNYKINSADSSRIHSRLNFISIISSSAV